MTRIPDDVVARVRAGSDLVALVQRRVPLKRSGGWWLGCCPFHGEKHPSFGVRAATRRFTCFACGAKGDAIDWLCRTEGFDFAGAVAELAHGLGLDWARGLARARAVPVPAAAKQAPAPDRDRHGRIAAARAIWRAARPIGGSHAEAYLRARGITVALPPSLRFAPALWHAPSQRKLPALVAGVQDQAGRVGGVWRIYLDPAAPQKAAVQPAKMGLGNAAGGAVRLAPLSADLMVAEGIESALALLQAFPERTVWAALSAGGFRTLMLPPEVRRVLFACDTDQASAVAASARAAELHEGGILAFTRRVEGAAKGFDPNDQLRAA